MSCCYVFKGNIVGLVWLSVKLIVICCFLWGVRCFIVILIVGGGGDIEGSLDVGFVVGFVDVVLFGVVMKMLEVGCVLVWFLRMSIL